MLFGFRILVVGAVNFSISALANQLHLLELREWFEIRAFVGSFAFLTVDVTIWIQLQEWGTLQPVQYAELWWLFSNSVYLGEIKLWLVLLERLYW